MRRWTQFALAAGLAMMVTACGGDSAPEQNEPTASAPREGAAATPGTAGTAGTANANADAEFVQEQLAMGEAEIQLGQLAQQRGSHPEVKRFGQMMVNDHRMAGEELKRIATSTTANRAEGHADTTKAEHGDHAETREELAKLSGREFDRRYIDQMIEDHEKGIDQVENKAEGANNAEVREWAAKTLPKMRQHLEKAKSIQETLNNDNSGNRKN